MFVKSNVCTLLQILQRSISKLVIEISCLQKLITHRQTHRRTDTTEYIISRRSNAYVV